MIKLLSKSVESTKAIGEQIGLALSGGEVIECASDLGGGKTTLISGIVKGFGSEDPVSSPSFTICNTYSRPDGIQIQHFDFYRLSDPGIMINEISEVSGDPGMVTLVEWADCVTDVLPGDRLIINIKTNSEDARDLELISKDSQLLNKLSDKLKDYTK